ncbi:D-aminoacyl-tRNA deacylase [Ignavigranum ruoffiae]|uniref:D-aminoacyl-tRNA deacylase n=1 Tax=Ignavigranum ruoffiae TaxID=89093 RepID=A0A1H8ZY63_9LACT|nr:D-aminoacyl-tRNA deacylase [Ignavigranum ruoffiae]UPQ85684.1 D-aminoacyl-tRNA deacylase [Ignavigranum ruoffiae]SEP69191.1 D-tyrosyl-tRNA(Tyr) deacylase [Ignavigranum ruoffiae]
MRAVIQSSLASKVSVDQRVIGQISKGMVVLVGVCQEDGPEDVEYLVRKISQLRIFEDAEGKTNLSLKDIEGEILSISQFTLYANTRKGNRPSFVRAADPALAQDLYQLFNQQLVDKGHHVETGEFGATMQVDISNNGPMTIILDSKQKDL